MLISTIERKKSIFSSSLFFLAFRHVFFYSPVNNCVVRALRHTNIILYFSLCLYRYKSYTPHLSIQTLKLRSKPLKAVSNLHVHRSHFISERKWTTSQFNCTLYTCAWCLCNAFTFWSLLPHARLSSSSNFFLLVFLFVVFYDSISNSSSFYVSLELDCIAS